MANNVKIKPDQIKEGDILEIPGAYPLAKQAGSTYVYVQEVIYAPNQGDRVLEIVVNEIIKDDFAQRLGRPFMRVNSEDASRVLKIFTRENDRRAILTNREVVPVANLGTSGEIKRITNIINSPLEADLLRITQSMPTGSDLRNAGEGPRSRQTMRYDNIVGGVLENLTPGEYRPKTFKAAEAKKGKITDLEIKSAIKAKIIDPQLGYLLMEDNITSLRRAFELVNKNPDRITKLAKDYKISANPAPNPEIDRQLDAMTKTELEELAKAVDIRIPQALVENVKSAWSQFEKDYTALVLGRNKDNYNEEIKPEVRKALLDKYTLAAQSPQKPDSFFMQRHDADYITTAENVKVMLLMRNMVANRRTPS